MCKRTCPLRAICRPCRQTLKSYIVSATEDGRNVTFNMLRRFVDSLQQSIIYRHKIASFLLSLNCTETISKFSTISRILYLSKSAATKSSLEMISNLKPQPTDQSDIENAGIWLNHIVNDPQRNLTRTHQGISNNRDPLQNWSLTQAHRFIKGIFNKT